MLIFNNSESISYSPVKFMDISSFTFFRSLAFFSRQGCVCLSRVFYAMHEHENEASNLQLAG